MTRNHQRLTPREIDQAIGEIRDTLPMSVFDDTLDRRATVHLWAATRMSDYLNEWIVIDRSGRKQQRALRKWMREEPARLERLIKSALRRLKALSAHTRQ